MHTDTRLTDPGQLDRLSSDELCRLVWPLVCAGRLPTSPAQRERMRSNIPSLCWQLRQEWQHDPNQGAFGDYLAARLLNRLRALDKTERPQAYDRHGRYLGEDSELPLDETLIAGTRPDPAGRLAAADDQPAGLQAMLSARAIAPATQAALATAIAKLQRREISSPFALQRFFGLSRSQARSNPATHSYLALRDYTNTTFNL